MTEMDDIIIFLISQNGLEKNDLSTIQMQRQPGDKKNKIEFLTLFVDNWTSWMEAYLHHPITLKLQILRTMPQTPIQVQ